MKRRHKATLILATLCCSLAAVLPASASAAAEPAWSLSVTPFPANFAPGATPEYFVVATNVGGAETTSTPSLIEATLPAGLKPIKVRGKNSNKSALLPPTCAIDGINPQKISCETAETIRPGQRFEAIITVEVSAAPGTYDLAASVHGGGGEEITTSFPTQVQSAPLAFDFLPGFKAPLTNEDGTPTTLAGTHPYQQTVTFAFPTEDPGDGITNAGHPRDFYTELPRGLVGNPAATPILCTEVQLTGKEGCDNETQIGVADVTTLAQGNAAVTASPIYNMVPAPGAAAELAINVNDQGVFVHILAGVRSDGDYGVQAATHDVIAFGTVPILALQAQIWGDPSSPAHDGLRGFDCIEHGTSFCEGVDPQQTAFLTAPVDCPAKSLSYEEHADTWEEPSPPFPEHRTSYEGANLAGVPASIKGCESLAFEPTLTAKPTTVVSDSPSGLQFHLNQPQHTDLAHSASAALKDITVRFPAGMTVNPAQASGLDACTQAQIGFTGADAQGAIHFSKVPQSCPAAAKIGSVEASTPLLVARDANQKIEEKEGKPVLEPLHGSVYIAQPFANPFGSLVAVYLAIEDEKTGIVAKLAGKGELNPQSGQITTYFKENPELPVEDIQVSLFGGARGALITPPTCGGYETKADLVPWSSGEATPLSDPFQITAAPGGGTCPTSEAQMPNAPKLSAGTVSPQAGKYSPLVFKLSREDGSQRLSKVEATLPGGLTAKLAGVAQCSEAEIAKARSREAPQRGVQEQADASCPGASEIGTVVGAAGAGPNPYYTSGRAYLAGPYKGAPLSVVTIVPAVAGPFDLGTVVVRIALYLNSETAQVRAVSDPLPTFLDGVPVDLRSVSMRLSRPSFSLNPTSCAEKAFAGVATSTLGGGASLAQRFQVGGCSSLPYKPTLTANLYGPIHRGGHPRLKTVFKARAGDANTARISFALPRSEFIDQSHFRTICTRVQFAANQCPAGSVYGYVKAKSPLVDYTVEGPIYLRSSAHKLPDVVAALRGPPSQPVEVDLDGRVDSVNGGIRTTFETVPDLPVTKAVVTLQGGKKGLFQNSTNICKGTHRATLKLDAQNGKVSDSQPLIKAQCKGAKGGKKGKKGGGKKRP